MVGSADGVTTGAGCLVDVDARDDVDVIDVAVTCCRGVLLTLDHIAIDPAHKATAKTAPTTAGSQDLRNLPRSFLWRSRLIKSSNGSQILRSSGVKSRLLYSDIRDRMVCAAISSTPVMRCISSMVLIPAKYNTGVGFIS